MAIGLSLHLGLNHVDPRHYAGWDGALVACEADARDMESLARRAGFKPVRLSGSEVTRAAVITAIRHGAKTLRAGDYFLLTYSGHGSQVPDGDGDETDHRDEAWVLFDRQMLDDDIRRQFAQFAAGVRIVVLSDSCHSGTVTQAPRSPARTSEGATDRGERYRTMPETVRRRTYLMNRDSYQRDRQASAGQGDPLVRAGIILISGCQDSQLSLDGDRNGLFTEHLKAVWDGGRFHGTHRDLRDAIAARMPATQTPRYLRTGGPDRGFDLGEALRLPAG